MVRIPLQCIRMTFPSSVITIRSSLSDTSFNAIRLPVLGVTFMVITPFPPRLCSLIINQRPFTVPVLRNCKNCRFVGVLDDNHIYQLISLLDSHTSDTGSIPSHFTRSEER